MWSELREAPHLAQNPNFPVFDRSLACLCKALSPEAHGLFAGQKPPSAALAADKTSVVSAAKKAATSDISIPSTTPRGRRRRPRGVVDPIEMSDVAAFLAADTTDVLAAGLARPKAERRRPKADLERVDALGAFRRPGHRPAGGRRPT